MSTEDPTTAHRAPSWAQAGDRITTPQGVPVDDTDNSLKVGGRGPTLLEDFHLRDKITHFDHERIPERVVHARGAGAHGHFHLYEPLDDLTCARFLCEPGPTPVFVRFSTVAGSRGSADTARDVRGFATRFYTTEGNFDLVGNNIPVFFIQDGIKFPDVIHAAKPEPDREIPQAQTAHDTFWDFVSLTPESTHMLLWVMSDRAIPRSYRTMEGFGVHTFRLTSARGTTSLVKFHWKPLAGVHSLVWPESQKLGGMDPDFHRRDLWNAIAGGAFPEWELGLQVLPDTDDQIFEGIDLLDPTKIVPEELAPVRRVGKMVLDRNPDNFFAETEQIAFHVGNLVRGIQVTDDPLVQARLFSYLDTQLTRLGGPNFSQIPINRPHAPVNDNHRDGFSQQAIHQGIAPYAPNSTAGGCPFASAEHAFVHAPRVVQGPTVRERASSFGDHYSQATMFWRSMSPIEQQHIVDGFSFELAKCRSETVRERTLERLASVDDELVGRVAWNLGVPTPAGNPPSTVPTSPALSMAPVEPGRIDGRVVGAFVAEGVDAEGLASFGNAIAANLASLHVIGPRAGTVDGILVDKAVFATDSVEFDALVVAGGCDFPPSMRVEMNLMLQEAYAHAKPLGAWGSGVDALASAHIPLDAAGIVTADTIGSFPLRAIEAMGWHRHWGRPLAAP